MTKRQLETEGFQTLAVITVLLVIAGCADPARVVLYDERYGDAKTSQRADQRPRIQAAARQTPSAPVGPAALHTARSGDTVYSVSQRYRVPIRGLITLNGLRAPYVLRSGQVLRLPKPRRHVVRPGDTIYGISRTYDVALSRLVQFNGIPPPYKIVVGRVLRLPDSVEPPAPASIVQTRYPSTAPSVVRSPMAGPRPETKRIRSNQSAAAAPKNTPVAVPKPPPLSNRKFLLPLRGRLVSRFGSKGKGLRNDGVNIAAARGTPVRAAENGIVVYSGNALLGFGNMVLLRHANGFMTAYAHNEAISVSRGDTVRRGQVIAKVGSTGNVAVPQLHFEIRKGKRAVNPAKYLPTLAVSS